MLQYNYIVVFPSPHIYGALTQDQERYKLISASEGEAGSIKIAAIDNGLSFPFKHPDEWRACEFFSYIAYL